MPYTATLYDLASHPEMNPDDLLAREEELASEIEDVEGEMVQLNTSLGEASSESTREELQRLHSVRNAYENELEDLCVILSDIQHGVGAEWTDYRIFDSSKTRETAITFAREATRKLPITEREIIFYSLDEEEVLTRFLRIFEAGEIKVNGATFYLIPCEALREA